MWRRILLALLLLSILTGVLIRIFWVKRGPKDGTVLVFRHAEKPLLGSGLSPQGWKRAAAYVDYFQHYGFHARTLRPAAIYAAADSGESHRPRLTMEALAKAEKLPLDTRFKSEEVSKLVKELRAAPPGKDFLVCWHHSDIPDLLRALGANPKKLLPGGKWPDERYDWVIELHFDADGKLMADGTRIKEFLVTKDAPQTAKTKSPGGKVEEAK